MFGFPGFNFCMPNMFCGNNIGGANPMNNLNNMGMQNNLNNFNICNMFNKMNCIKGIKNYQSPMESSFANSVLQSLACLNCIQQWYNQLYQFNCFQMNNFQNSLTKQFFILLNCLYSGNPVDSYNIIYQFNFECNKLYNNKNIQNDPFHFLYYFLELWHCENNYIINPMFNAIKIANPDINSMKNDSNMFNLYVNFFKSTQNSVVSRNFFNILKYETKCSNLDLNCSPLYYYSHNTILRFNVDKYKGFRDELFPFQKGMNINLDVCFKCLTGGNKKQCQLCGNFETDNFISLFFSSKVLIFAFKRNNHLFKCDIDFDIKINIGNYCNQNINGTNNTIYNLKACIGINNYGRYFADVLINGNWYRFLDDQCMQIYDFYNQLHSFEPQILIYELEEAQNFQNFPFFNNNFFTQLNQFQQKQQLMQIGNWNIVTQNYNLIKGLK